MWGFAIVSPDGFETLEMHFKTRLGSLRFVDVPFVDVSAQSVLGNANGQGTVEAVRMSGLWLVSFLHTSCVFGAYYLTSQSHGERAVLPVLLGLKCELRTLLKCFRKGE